MGELKIMTKDTSLLEANHFEALVERGAILKALSHVLAAVEKKNVMNILNNVKIVVGNNYIELTATDTEISVTDKIKAEILSPGALTVNAQTFYDIVRKLPDDSKIELSTNNDTKQLIIRSRNCKFTLSYLSAQDFPVMQEGEMTHEFTIAKADLSKAIERNRFAIAMDETRYNLGGIYLHEANGFLRATATDGHRLSVVNIALPKEALDVPGIIIPRKAIFEIKKLLDDSEDNNVKIELSTKKIKFTFADTILISKLIDATYPEYEGLIPKDNQKILQIDTDSFSKAIDRVSTISFEKLRVVKLTITEEKIIVSATSEANCAATEEIIANYNDNNEFEIVFNSRYLLDILSVIKGETVELLFGDKYSPTLLRDLTDDSSIYVIMPVLI